jgi:hypothetical protein
MGGRCVARRRSRSLENASSVCHGEAEITGGVPGGSSRSPTATLGRRLGVGLDDQVRLLASYRDAPKTHRQAKGRRERGYAAPAQRRHRKSLRCRKGKSAFRRLLGRQHGVGVAPVDPGIGDTGVGRPGLAATADSDGAADVPGARTQPPSPLGSSGGTVLGGDKTPIGGDTADSVVAGAGATSATAGYHTAITDASGNSGTTFNPAGTLAGSLTETGGVHAPDRVPVWEARRPIP